MPSNPNPRRPLGKNGSLVPALGFGLMGLSHSTYGIVPGDEERFAILDKALELGATFWDSSDLYGDNEDLIAKWFKKTGKRDEIFLATKFGFVKGSATFETNTSAAYCKQACEASLKRLGIDCIDLYYVHNANPETPIEETMRALVELQAERKIKHIGLAAVSSTTLRRACKIAQVSACQTEYSVFSHDIEGPAGSNLLSTCRELGVAIVVATPLGRGLISTAYGNGETLGDSTDKRPHIMPRFQEDNREHNMKLVNQFKAFADKKGCTPSQLALAWVMKQGDDIFPIPGTKRLKYLEENCASLGVTLTNEEDVEIRAFGAASELAGSSNPPAFASYLYRDTKEESA